MTGIALVIIWIALAIVAWQSDAIAARGLRWRLVTLLGIVAIWGSFFSLPWIRFDFTAYLDESGWKILTENIGLIGELLHIDKLTSLLDVVFNTAFLNGLSIQASPFLTFRTRVAILTPSFFALFVFLIFPWTIYFRGSLFSKIWGTFLIFGSILIFFLLASAMNEIDALGATHHAGWTLLIVLLGTHIGSGPSITLAGLLFLLVGGLVEWFDEGINSQASSTEMEAWL